MNNLISRIKTLNVEICLSFLFQIYNSDWIVLQNGEIVGEFGDRGGESIEDLFYTCGDNDQGMRCQKCNKDRGDIFRIARRYITYESRSGRCYDWR